MKIGSKLKNPIYKWLLIFLIIMLLLAPFASSKPDGLERVAIDRGFAENTSNSSVMSIMPDYMIPGIGNEKAATALAGGAGALILLGLFYGAEKVMAVLHNKERQ